MSETVAGTDVAGPEVDEVIDATAIPILEFGRGWMMAPATAARAVELGIDDPFGFWVNGRAGALGEVTAEVAAAAIGFMAPDRVRQAWEARPASLPPRDAAAAYAEAAASWGRTVLADLADADLDRLADLCDIVIGAANPSIGALFAGWSSIARPADPAGRATVCLQILRELRGGAHLSAAHAVGLGPHGAIISADDQVRGGVPGATRFGWPEPHPPVDQAARAEAERLTTVICRPAYAGLDSAERRELVSLVTSARATLDS